MAEKSEIMGIGASERPRAVRRAKAKDIVTTWLITIPCGAAIAILTWFVLQIFL